MTDIEKLLAIEEIKSLKARYFRYIDLKMWPELRSIFTPDVTLEYVNVPGGPFGLEDGMAMIVEFMTGRVTIHQGFMPEIEITSPTTAKAVWGMEDGNFIATANAGEHTVYKMRGHGHYHDTYEKLGGAWRIKSTRLTRILRSTETQLVTIY